MKSHCIISTLELFFKPKIKMCDGESKKAYVSKSDVDNVFYSPLFLKLIALANWFNYTMKKAK